MTQKEMIIDYIRHYGSITSWEAMKHIGCMRLASRINDLRNDGYYIARHNKTSKNRYGKNVTYAVYTLEGKHE